MDWTKAQLKTIETRNKNILVSAAAGSGKTAVLVERIKQLMLKDKTDIDRFLITTFTNAASAEMRERLEKAVNEELKKPDADKAFLRKQLLLMPAANISTFHTFALEVMRKFFYLTDLEPGFKIGDDIEVDIMKRQAADELFETRFDEDYEAFTVFLTKYGSERSDKKIRETIISLYDRMRSIPDYFDWASERTELLNADSPSEALGLIGFVNGQCLQAVKKAEGYYSRAADLLEEAGLEKLWQKANRDAETIRKGAAAVEEGGIAAMTEFYANLSLNRMSAAKDEKEDYEEIKERVSLLRKKGKKLIDDVYKKYFARAIEEYDEELKAGYDDTVYMIGLVKELEELFRAMKREKNIVDFDDVMHYAADILRDDMAAAEYRDKFRYIFIDEFQDSNMLQEIIAGRIAGDDNLFMVGDVKQSIYKFRLAEPEIFKAKYALYSKESEEKSIKIDLSSNFRSKRMVTGIVNEVFRGIMEGYDENAELKCTVEDEYPGITPQLHLILKEGSEDGLMESPKAEAQQVARLVKENLGTEIYDVKRKTYRPVEYRDIAVLSRSRAMIGEIERTLNNSGIPAYGENTGGYFETVEIQVFINLLKVIDNFRQDIPLISVMRCPIFGFDVKELAAIRIFTGEGAYHEAVKRYGEEGSDDYLKEQVRKLLEKIDYWKALKTTVSLEELIRTLLYDTGYFDYCSGLPVGKQRILNLQLLVQKAGAFEASDYSGLYGFLSYADAMKSSRIDMGEAGLLTDSDNVVRVMTVHKSKGLEFPIVILAGAGRQIKAGGSGMSASMHKDLAIGLPNVNLEEKWHRKTLLQRVTDGKKAVEEYEEEIRILYVAMTRAMDRLMVTGVVKDMDRLEEAAGDPKSYAEMIYEPMKTFGGEILVHDSACGEEMPESRVSAGSRTAELFRRSRQLDPAQRPGIIDRVLSFEYPYSRLDKVKSKYSVTELVRHDAEENTQGHADRAAGTELILGRPEFAGERKLPDAAQTGTAMHLMMERLDFQRCACEGISYITEKADAMTADGELSEEERAVIDTKRIAAFFEQPVGKRAVCALRLEKEREFILRRDIEGASAIVQGIIDCYFEEEDGLVLVDYKNSFVCGAAGEDEIRGRYRGQMELYREALEGAEKKPVKEAYLYLFGVNKFVRI